MVEINLLTSPWQCAKSDRMAITKLPRIKPAWPLAASCARDSKGAVLDYAVSVAVNADCTTRCVPQLQVDFRLNGWEELRYVELTWTDERDRPFRTRLRHLENGHPHQLELRPDSLLFGLENNWTTSAPRTIRSCQVLVYGKPAANATLEIARARLRLLPPEAATPSIAWAGKTGKIDDLATIKQFTAAARPNLAFRRWYQDYWGMRDPVAKAEDYLERGLCDIMSVGQVQAPCFFNDLPQAKTYTTLAFRWQALNQSTCLMLAALDLNTSAPRRREYVYGAREIALHWASKNMHGAPEDANYTWYDHGTGERLINLLMVWDLGLQEGFSPLVMRELLGTIHRHARLLASEPFFAWNQPLLYHNHAVFQFISLLILAQVIPEFQESDAWRELADAQLKRQMEHIFTPDGATVENSAGYQTGMEGIIDLVLNADWRSGAANQQYYRELKKKVHEFSADILYPDGTVPMYGDTWRDRAIPRNTDWKKNPARPDGFYDESGYAILRAGGRHNLQLNMICSSRTQTHKHADNLSFTLWLDGVEWLTDAGLYGYQVADAHGRYYNHARAHNAMLPDDELSYVPAPGTARILSHESGAERSEVLAEHTGYPGYAIQRRIRVDRKNHIVFLEDTVSSKPAHAASRPRLWFHCGPHIQARAEGGRIAMAAPQVTTTSLAIVPLYPEAVAIDSYRGQTVPFAAGWAYTQYKAFLPTTSCRFMAKVPTDKYITAIVADPQRFLTGNPAADRKKLLSLYAGSNN